MSTFEHNKVDIYIEERNGTQKIRVPWLPASIEYKSGDQVVASYDILNRGEVSIPTGTGLRSVKFESQFPGPNRRNDTAMLRGTWQDPSYYHKILEQWKEKGTALKLAVTGYPINLDVYLSIYEATAAGGFGDMEYTVEFTEDRDITISSTKKKTDQNSTKKRQSKKKKTYKIKKGDTLWKIAKKQMGSGKKWKSLYKANKKIIEKTAKKRGYKSSNNGKRIFAGTKLTIPNS